jgi:hypothetical protein
MRGRHDTEMQQEMPLRRRLQKRLERISGTLESYAELMTLIESFFFRFVINKRPSAEAKKELWIIDC